MPVTRILIVDDDPQMRAMLAMLVSLAAITAETAPDADTAERVVDEATPDAVLLDVRLSGRDGFVLADALRARHPTLPIILMSGDVAGDEMRARAQAMGLHFLPKPFEPVALLSLLRGS